MANARSSRLVGISVLALSLMSIGQAQSLTWLGVLPGGTASQGSGVSVNGVVVGRSTNSARQWRAFRWDPINGMQDLGVLPGGTQSNALAISADGTTIVGTSRNASGQDRAVRWTTAGIEDLGTLGGVRATATAVSADGSYIVGWALNSSNATRAFRWSASAGMQDLGTLGGTASLAYGVSADGAVVVGTSNLPQGWQRAFLWSAATGTMLNLNTLGGTRSGAAAVSADGQVVVGSSYQDNIQTNRAYQWTASQGIQALPSLPGFLGSDALAVSCDGSIIVGSVYPPGEEPVAVRWTASGVENLNLTYASLLASGSVLYTATAISADGRYIVGTGYNAATNRSEAFLLDTGPQCVPHDGDVNQDGCVDDADLLTVLFAFGQQGGCGLGRVDVNCDGTVDDADLLQVLFHFGGGC